LKKGKGLAAHVAGPFLGEGGRAKREEGRGKREEGRGKREEGRGKGSF